HFQTGRQRTQEVHVVRGQHALVVFQGAARIAVERLEWDAPDDRYVMIPQETGQTWDLTDQLQHGIWIGAITHHIAQAPGFVDRTCSLQNSLESRVICMNVRDHQDSHITPKVLQPAPKSLQPLPPCSSTATLPDVRPQIKV